jgi:hypothetical protein
MGSRQFGHEIAGAAAAVDGASVEAIDPDSGAKSRAPANRPTEAGCPEPAMAGVPV